MSSDSPSFWRAGAGLSVTGLEGRFRGREHPWEGSPLTPSPSQEQGPGPALASCDPSNTSR